MKDYRSLRWHELVTERFYSYSLSLIIQVNNTFVPKINLFVASKQPWFGWTKVMRVFLIDSCYVLFVFLFRKVMWARHSYVRSDFFQQKCLIHVYLLSSTLKCSIFIWLSVPFFNNLVLIPNPFLIAYCL